MVANTPRAISFLMTSGAETFSRRANSPTVISSGTLNGDVLGLALLGDALQPLGLGLPLALALLAPGAAGSGLVNFCLFTMLSVFTFWSASRSY